MVMMGAGVVVGPLVGSASTACRRFEKNNGSFRGEREGGRRGRGDDGRVIEKYIQQGSKGQSQTKHMKRGTEGTVHMRCAAVPFPQNAMKDVQKRKGTGSSVMAASVPGGARQRTTNFKTTYQAPTTLFSYPASTLHTETGCTK